MNKNIVLVGLMGAGKTSVGRLLAEKLGIEFYDTDDVIENEAGCSIVDIFSQKGEQAFRELEKKTILKLSQKSGNIISTGGGSLENEENLKNLKKNGLIVYLKASPEVLYERIKNQKNRPLLKNGSPLKTLKELLEKREQAYKRADYIIDTALKTAEDVTNEIVKVYNARIKC